MHTKIIKLVEELNYYRDQYYNHANPVISDSEYDALFDLLVQLEQETGIVFADSPTHTVGFSVLDNLNKTKFPIPMLSLAKTKDINDIKSFAQRNRWLLMKKFDGCSVSAVYENGKLVLAATRGNGHEGEDITHNFRTFVGIPTTIPYKGKLILAGEAIVYKEDFECMNRSLPVGEKPYSHPRNFVSGSIRQLNSEVCANRRIHFIVWDVLYGFENKKFKSEKLNSARLNGFDVADFVLRDAEDTSDLENNIETFKMLADSLGIPIDGMVVKYDNIEYGESRGGTSHHKNDALAFKFEDEVKETTLRNIVWAVGKTGQMSPVAIFDAIDLDGAIVQRASVHNYSYIKDMRLNIGDKIGVTKQNMIIPGVIRNFSAEENDNKPIIEPPSTCPVCGQKLKRGILNGVDSFFCENPSCGGKKLEQFKNFVSKQAMNIEGLSESTLRKFLNKGWLDNYADIYNLNKYQRQIETMPGFGSKSYMKLWNAIEKSRTVTLNRLIVALGIPGIGKSAAETISDYCRYDIRNFYGLIGSKFNWTALDDFGEILNKNIHDWFANESNFEVFQSLWSQLNLVTPNKKVEQNGVFNNKTIVITGVFNRMTRHQLVELIENMGAKVVNSVSKKTDFLLAGEKAGSKLGKAKELGIRVVTESEFIEMIMDREGIS